MRKTSRILTSASAIAIAVALASAPNAHESDRSSGAGEPAGRGGMMGMMQMMGNMGSMMEGCSQMMQGMSDRRGAAKPNEQWRPSEPATPERSR